MRIFGDLLNLGSIDTSSTEEFKLIGEIYKQGQDEKCTIEEKKDNN